MNAVMEEAPTLGRKFEKVCLVLERYGHNPSRLIPILQAVQEEYRYLPQEVLTYIATCLDVPPARVYGVATFYSHFAMQPRGKYVVRVCDGTACHVKGSITILDAVKQDLGLQGKQKTTADLLFTVETVACLGACGLAPVAVVNDEIHGQVTPEAGVEIIQAMKVKEAGK